MFAAIFRHELKYWFKNPSVYVYAIAILLMATGMMAGISGVFGEESGGFKGISNAPLQLYSFILLFNKLLLLVMPAIIGNGIYRDYASKTDRILYTYPFSKAGYLSGKFLSAFTVVILISAMAGVGLMIGARLPGVDASLIAPFDLQVYLQLYGMYLIPNLLFSGMLVFAVVAFSRNIYAGFITAVVLLIGREMLARLTGSPENSMSPALLLEPFAETATHFYTRHWTAAARNELPIPIGAAIIYNRLFWLLCSALLAGFVYRYFSFHQNARFFSVKKKKTDAETEQHRRAVDIPVIAGRFSTLGQFRTAWKIALSDLRYTSTSGAFLSILVTGCLFVLMLLLQMNAPYETRILPHTWVMLAFPVFFFSLLIQWMTFLYAGIFIQRARTAGMQDLIDVTPVPSWALLLSKVLALALLQMMLLTVLMLAGMSVQTYQGYYHFEIEHYLFDLFGIHLIGFVIWAFAAVFVQTLFTNPYIGLFFLMIGSFGIDQLPQLGIKALVFRFNQDPQPGFFLQYSDLSGYGHALMPYFLFKLYWLVFGLILFCLSLLFWQRGTPLSFRERLGLARKRCKGRPAFALSALTVLFLGMGAWLQHSGQTLPRILTDKETEQVTARADQQYGRYAGAIQPRVVRVAVNMHIYPESLRFQSDGVYVMVNKSAQPIDSLLVSTAFSVRTNYRFDRAAVLLHRDSSAHFDIQLLENSLLPGDTMRLIFEIQNIPNNLLYKNSIVERNGSFITSSIYPAMGYYLPFPNENPPALNNHYRSIDSDYVDFEAIVSTGADQIAITPGYLQRQWGEQGRQFFHYKSGTPVTSDFVITSGRYEVKRDAWKNIPLEIYYHKGHEHNLDHLMEGMKATLDYCEHYFSPYQHQQLRIIEYSRAQGDFGQSFANTIPVSEISFIMDNDDAREGSLNLSFLGASHELAHQWWGHQVIPADVPGLRMITESTAEYVSLQVLKRRYGAEKAQLFLKKTRDIYLQKRAADTEAEKPLMYNTGLQKKHIPYQKGVLVLNAMSMHIGEERLNGALQAYLNKVKFQTAPYTTSREMLDYIRQATPDSLQYLIRDLFERVHVDDKLLK